MQVEFVVYDRLYDTDYMIYECDMELIPRVGDEVAIDAILDAYERDNPWRFRDDMIDKAIVESIIWRIPESVSVYCDLVWESKGL